MNVQGWVAHEFVHIFIWVPFVFASSVHFSISVKENGDNEGGRRNRSWRRMAVRSTINRGGLCRSSDGAQTVVHLRTMVVGRRRTDINDGDVKKGKKDEG
ncbi:hypothetical protein L484_017504 [Morus notabilis]|uniref:Uncharacterized protein n=1 Tax=Morus notabilis TaxID=981085 RepID=W9QTK9_9ROSA|nr:hypothetical protein L484_017504 [Morus notabilis]